MSLNTKYICECGSVLELCFPSLGWGSVSAKEMKSYATKRREDHQYIHCKDCGRITHIHIKADLTFSGTIHEEKEDGYY